MCCLAPKGIVRKYRFAEDQEDPKSVLVVLIPEVLDPQYGMYVWPCAVVLAQYVWFHRRLVCDKRILELGAGVSLPGIVAAKCGAEIILSDNASSPQCLDNCHRSCRMNNLFGVLVKGLTWGQISPALLTLPPVDIILASDVFFEPEDFEDVVSTVHYLMEKNPCAQFWTTYQVRRVRSLAFESQYCLLHLTSYCSFDVEILGTEHRTLSYTPYEYSHRHTYKSKSVSLILCL